MNYRAWGIPAVLSRGIPGNALRAFPGSFRNFSGISSGKSQPYWGCGPFVRNEKSAQRPKFSAGRPCGHPAKNFGQALQILENKHFGTDMPRGRPRKKLRSERLRADFSFPNLSTDLDFRVAERFGGRPQGDGNLKMKKGPHPHTFSLTEKMARFTKGNFRKGRTWAIAVRRGSYKSLFLLNSGRFCLEKSGKFSSELLVRVKRSNRYGPSSFISNNYFVLTKDPNLPCEGQLCGEIEGGVL